LRHGKSAIDEKRCSCTITGLHLPDLRRDLHARRANAGSRNEREGAEVTAPKRPPKDSTRRIGYLILVLMQKLAEETPALKANPMALAREFTRRTRLSRADLNAAGEKKGGQ